MFSPGIVPFLSSIIVFTATLVVAFLYGRVKRMPNETETTRTVLACLRIAFPAVGILLLVLSRSHTSSVQPATDLDLFALGAGLVAIFLAIIGAHIAGAESLSLRTTASRVWIAVGCTAACFLMAIGIWFIYTV